MAGRTSRSSKGEGRSSNFSIIYLPLYKAGSTKLVLRMVSWIIITRSWLIIVIPGPS